MQTQEEIDSVVHRRYTLAVVLPVVIALMTACAETPKTVSKATPEPPANDQATDIPEPPAPAAVPASAPRVPTAQDRTEAQALAKKAIEPLNTGDEASARRDLQRALDLDPENKLAGSLLRQITDDPVEMLGAQYFTHRVQRDESLSMLAERYLNNIYLFYALARYNGIKVPKQLSAGHEIRIPGKRPVAAVVVPTQAPKPKPPIARPNTPAPQTDAAPHEAAAVSPGESAYQQGLKWAKSDKDKAYDMFVQAVHADPQHQQARGQADRLRGELIQQHTRLATAAFRRDQDMPAAIRHWDRVLQLDPNDDSAKANRAKAARLYDKIRSGNYPATN
jgi:tetratricopeptide (TPR) repeat protein